MAETRIIATKADSDTESEMVRLLRRGRVGGARTRLHRGIYWEVDFGYPLGKKQRRLRKYFKSPTKAYRAALKITQELKHHGALALHLSATERMEAVQALEKLRPLGSTLTEAVEFFVERHPMGGLKRSIEQVAEELIAKKAGGNRRDRYVKSLEARWRGFSEEMGGGRRIGSVTTEDIERILAKYPHWGPTTIKGYVSSLKVLFYYAVKRGYCVENPCLRLELPKKIDKEVQIVDVPTVQRMLDVANGPDFDCTTYIAIGLFAGIRPDEIEKLQWEQVDFENKTIVVLSGSAKGRARRIVDMSPNLMAWIAPYKKTTGGVVAHPINELRAAMRARMKFDRWPHNVMRHCFASYHFAKHRNEHLLMQLMGHGDDGRILHNHYRALVQPNAAEAFWKIFPPCPNPT